MAAATSTAVAETKSPVEDSSSPGQKNVDSLLYSSRRTLLVSRQSSQDFLGYESPSFHETHVVMVSWQTAEPLSQYSPGACWAITAVMARAMYCIFSFNLLIIIINLAICL